MSFPKNIKVEKDSSFEEDQYSFNNSDNLNQQDQSTVSIKTELEVIHDYEDLQYNGEASISTNVVETIPADEIKMEITIEETKVEQYSEFEKRSECDITFADASAFQYHNHNQQPLFNCSYCSQQFHSNILLHQHIASHKNILEQGQNKKFECQQCLKQFQRFENFDKHIKQHDIDKEAKYTFTESQMDETHQIKHEITIEEPQLQENVKHGTSKKEFPCKFCDFTFGGNTPLQIHIREAHSDVGSFRCGICRNIFKGISELEKHIAEAHQGLGIECIICLTQYREDDKADHKTKCLGRQLFNCDHCNMSFLRKAGAWKHLDEHDVQEYAKESSISETRIKQQFCSCEICGDDRAYKKRALKEHAKEQHGGHYLLCPDCGTSFADNGNRNRHMEKYCKVGIARERFKSEELKCSQCSKSCQNKAALEGHMVRYHRKTPYQCTECEMVFSCGPKLRQHKVDIHIKPTINCSYCSKKFKFKSELVRHNVIHENILDESQKKQSSDQKCSDNKSRDTKEHVQEDQNTSNYSGFASEMDDNLEIKTEITTEETRVDDHGVQDGVKWSSIIETHTRKQIFSCEICGDDIAYEEDPLMEHATDQHGGHCTICSDCEKALDNTNNRKTPMEKICSIEPPSIAPQESENLKCPKCPKLYQNREALKSHMYKNHRNKPYKCTQCDMKFSNAHKMGYHRITTHKEFSFSCSVCEKKFKFESRLQKHLLSHQEPNNYNICIDSETFENLQTKHEITIDGTNTQETTHETNIKQFSCKFCEFIGEGTTPLLTHIREAHPDHDTLRRSIYRTVFDGTSEIDKHVAEIYRLGNECNICLTQYRKDRKADHKNKCLGRQLFNCVHCKISYLEKEALLKHLDEHGVSEDLKESSSSETRTKRQFLCCEICRDNRAYARDSRREHAKEQHNGHYLLCPDCGKTFIDSSNRKNHMKKFCRIGPARERFNLEQVECPECSKLIINSVVLESHMEKYHRKNPYECTECKMKFTSGPKLRKHKIKIHMERIISCSYCTKKFKFNYELQRHMTSHKIA